MSALRNTAILENTDNQYLNVQMYKFMCALCETHKIDRMASTINEAIAKRLSKAKGRHPKHSAFPSRKQIAKDCNCSLRTIDNHMGTIEQFFDIAHRKNKRGRDTSNLYTLKEFYIKQFEARGTPVKTETQSINGGAAPAPEVIKVLDLKLKSKTKPKRKRKISIHSSKVKLEFAKNTPNIPHDEKISELNKFVAYNIELHDEETLSVKQAVYRSIAWNTRYKRLAKNRLQKNVEATWKRKAKEKADEAEKNRAKLAGKFFEQVEYDPEAEQALRDLNDANSQPVTPRNVQTVESKQSGNQEMKAILSIVKT